MRDCELCMNLFCISVVEWIWPVSSLQIENYNVLSKHNCKSKMCAILYIVNGDLNGIGFNYNVYNLQMI